MSHEKKKKTFFDWSGTPEWWYKMEKMWSIKLSGSPYKEWISFYSTTCIRRWDHAPPPSPPPTESQQSHHGSDNPRRTLSHSPASCDATHFKKPASRSRAGISVSQLVPLRQNCPPVFRHDSTQVKSWHQLHRLPGGRTSDEGLQARRFPRDEYSAAFPYSQLPGVPVPGCVINEGPGDLLQILVDRAGSIVFVFFV